MITIPERLQSKAGSVIGGREWLAQLPDVCRRLCDEWSIDLGSSFPDGHVSLVTPPTKPDADAPWCSRFQYLRPSNSELSQPGPTQVLLHGAFHRANILSALWEPWLAIDPLPMIGDPAYDSVQYLLFRMGDRANPSAEWERDIEQFCQRLDIDAERVKAWLFARLVSDAVAACTQGATMVEHERPGGDLWAARLVHRLRRSS